VRALVLGGTGQVGRAAARRLVDAGYEVTVIARAARPLPDELLALGVAGVRADRSDTEAVGAAIGDGVDVLVDAVAFNPGDADQLNRFASRIGSQIVISSASVYVDSAGRSLDEASSEETFPRLPVPISEDQPTVAAGDETYSTRKVAIERALLDGPIATTVIRPCAIYGPGSNLPRELFFVKRVLDRRRRVVLVSNGASRFHTTSAENLAELIRLAAAQPADRILNCGDPEPPTVAEIGSVLAPDLEQIAVPESGYERRDVSNPWAVPFPFVVEMRKAASELGYRPVATYAQAVPATRDWLVAELRRRDWAGTYLDQFFNYDAEDALLRARG
jgi:nucleoside-diphosphate-sugar epimerase